MKTLNFKKILVPFDFSESFENSLKMAFDLTQKSGATLTILNVVNQTEIFIGNYVVGCTVPLSDPVSLVEKQQVKILNYLSKEGYNLQNIEVSIETGNYNNSIINLNKINEYDLIVIPDFKKNPLNRLFSEITPLEIMKKTNTAVIAVNRNTDSFSIKRIILPIRNVKNWYDKIPFTSALAKITGAKVYIVGVTNAAKKGVVSKIEKKVEFCKEHFTKLEVRYESEFIVAAGKVFRDIILLSKYKRADLIAVSPPLEYSKLKNYFSSSLYTKLITNSNIPVMGVTLT
jgi:nucleotide-binding universal stress UspA family protein